MNLNLDNFNKDFSYEHSTNTIEEVKVNSLIETDMPAQHVFSAIESDLSLEGGVINLPDIDDEHSVSELDIELARSESPRQESFTSF